MGRTYSLNGYLNAALRRGKKTILVEGPSDKNVLHRVELQKFPEKVGNSNIDQVAILEDPLLAGKGNREKVQMVAYAADQISASLTKMPEVLATLIDREWDGVSFSSYAVQDSWAPPHQSDNRFCTLGHSIENYCFDFECVAGYLDYMYPGRISGQMRHEVSEHFPAILLFATVLSLRVRDAACLNRCAGLIDHFHVLECGHRIELDNSFSNACMSRGIAIAPTVVAEVNAGISLAWEHLHAKEFSMWLPHGHLGDEAIWAAVAMLLLNRGIGTDLANEISHGHKIEKGRFKAHWVSQIPRQKRMPLDESIDWLHT